MDNSSIPGILHSISRMWRILGILMLVSALGSALGGCIGRESKPAEELPAQDGNGDNLTLTQNVPEQNESISNTGPRPNQLRLILRPKELNRTGRLPVTLLVMNTKLNETVITVFRPQFGQEFYNVTNITYLVNSNWTQNFSIRPIQNVSYVQMFVQISENGSVVKKAAWNITFDTPVGKAT